MSVGTTQRPCCGLERRGTSDLGGTDAADDVQGPQYYLRLATASDPLRQVEVQSLDSAALLTAESAATSRRIVDAVEEGWSGRWKPRRAK